MVRGSVAQVTRSYLPTTGSGREIRSPRSSPKRLVPLRPEFAATRERLASAYPGSTRY
jgi:hypothetical protein